MLWVVWWWVWACSVSGRSFLWELLCKEGQAGVKLACVLRMCFFLTVVEFGLLVCLLLETFLHLIFWRKPTLKMNKASVAKKQTFNKKRGVVRRHRKDVGSKHIQRQVMVSCIPLELLWSLDWTKEKVLLTVSTHIVPRCLILLVIYTWFLLPNLLIIISGRLLFVIGALITLLWWKVNMLQ